MAGLVPAIHVLGPDTSKKDVDARHKAGHDDLGYTASSPRRLGHRELEHGVEQLLGIGAGG